MDNGLRRELHQPRPAAHEVRKRYSIDLSVPEQINGVRVTEVKEILDIYRSQHYIRVELEDGSQHTIPTEFYHDSFRERQGGAVSGD